MDRPQSPTRRGLARPSRRLNLLVSLVGLMILMGAQYHRRALDATFSRIVRDREGLPDQIAKVRIEPAAMGLARVPLDRELQTVVEIENGVERELPPGTMIRAGATVVLPPVDVKQRRFDKVPGSHRLIY